MISNEEIQKHVIEARPKWQAHSGSPTAFGMYYDTKIPKPKWTDYPNQACLGNLEQQNFSHFSVFYILSKSPDTESSRAYLSWLTGRESPWRVLTREQPEQDLENILKYGWYLTSLDYPSNLVVNLLTAFRLPGEKPFLVDLWHRLVTDGVSPGVAASVLCYVVPYNYGKDQYNLYHYNQGHIAFSPHVSDLSFGYRLNNGLVYPGHLTGHTFRSSTKNLPCNYVWTEYKDADGWADSKNSQDSPFTKLFFSFITDGRPPGFAQDTRRFKNPQEEIKVKPNVTMYSPILAFCQYLDQLQPEKDFKI